MGVAAWDPNPYPDPRLKRGELRSEQGPFDDAIPAPRLPRTYLWSFVLGERGNNQRGTIASRKLTGPAIIKQITLDIAQPTDSGDKVPLLQIYYSLAPPTQGSGQAEAFPAGAISITDFTRLRDDALLIDPGQPGFPLGANSVAGTTYTIPLNYLVNDREFYLGVALVSRSDAGGSSVGGTFTIYEDCDQALVPTLLAG